MQAPCGASTQRHRWHPPSRLAASLVPARCCWRAGGQRPLDPLSASLHPKRILESRVFASMALLACAQGSTVTISYPAFFRQPIACCQYVNILHLPGAQSHSHGQASLRCFHRPDGLVAEHAFGNLASDDHQPFTVGLPANRSSASRYQ
jgi:hypothetical protein